MEGDDVAAVERRVAVEADGAAAVGGRAAVEDRGASLERGMQQVLGASGIFMFLWVFVLFPGSAYTGFQGHDAWIDWLFETFPLFGLIAPVSLITKYNELGHLPAFTHAVPGAVWSILAPLQLLPELRKRMGAGAHAQAGRVMLVCAALLMMGYFIIDANELYSDVHDFGGHGGGIADSIDQSGLLPMSYNLLGVRMLAGYFIASAAATLTFAKRGEYAKHRRWAIRHVGAGLWVSAQRPAYAVVRLLQAAVLGPGTSVTASAEADAFYYAAYATTVTYFVAAEWLARRPGSVTFGNTSSGASVPSPNTDTNTAEQMATSATCDAAKCAAAAEALRKAPGVDPADAALLLPQDDVLKL